MLLIINTAVGITFLWVLPFLLRFYVCLLWELVDKTTRKVRYASMALRIRRGKTQHRRHLLGESKCF